MQLTSFSVTGFRSLTAVRDIPVGSPTILAGHNDGGKTAVLDALTFLVNGGTLPDEDRTFTTDENGVRNGDRTASTVVEGAVILDAWEQRTFDLPASCFFRRIATGDSAPRLEVKKKVAEDVRLQQLDALKADEMKELVRQLGLTASGATKALLLAALQSYADSLPKIDAWVAAPKELEARLPELHNFGGGASDVSTLIRAALMKQYKTHVNDLGVSSTIEDLQAKLGELLHQDIAALGEHIQGRWGDMAEVLIEPAVGIKHSFDGVSVSIARGGGDLVGLDRSGMGSNRRVRLAAWEWMSDSFRSNGQHMDVEEDAPSPRQMVLIYDEPDTHLDFNHQRKVMDLIRDQCKGENVAVLVATHSMNLIDGVDIEDVVHLKHDEFGRTVVEQLRGGSHDEIEVHLGRIAAAVGLRNSVLLHERCFLAVEGETEQQCIPVLFRLSEGLPLQSAGVALWACGNNEGALHLAGYLARHGRSVFLLVDADSEAGNKMFREESLRRVFGTAPRYIKYVGKPNHKELEGVFSDQLWSDTANKIWPCADGTVWSPSDFEALRSERKFSDAVLKVLQARSTDAPSGKPQMMFELASSLSDPDDVPRELRLAFAEIREIAR